MLTPYVFATERPRRLSNEEKDALQTFLAPVERVSRVPFSEPRRGKLNHYPVHVRFSDVDVYGHVNNVKYFEYFQEARILYTARLWRDLLEERGRIATVVAQTDVDYKVPILFRPEPYDGWTWLSHVGNRSMVVESEIRDGDLLLSRSRVAMVFFDAETQRAVAPPEDYLRPLLEVLG